MSDAEPDFPSEDLQEAFAAFEQNMSDGDFESLELAMMRIFVAAGEWAEQNPSRELELNQQAGDCEESGDWQGAVLAYLELLKLAETPTERMKAYQDIAWIHALQEREAEALAMITQAEAAARESDSEVVLAMHFTTHAKLLCRYDKFERAEQLAAEGLQLLAADNPLYGHVRADLFLAKAESDVGLGELAAAEAALHEAFEILQPQSVMEFASGVHFSLGSGWRVKAKLFAAKREPREQINSLANAIANYERMNAVDDQPSVWLRSAQSAVFGQLAIAHAAAGEQSQAIAARARQVELQRSLKLG